MKPNNHKNTRKFCSGRAFVAAGLLALGCNQAAASQPTDSGRTSQTERQLMNDIETLKQAEQTWVSSLTTGDAKLLATIIDEEFSFIGPDGQREERQAYLAGYEAMPKLGVVVERIDLSEVDVRVLNEIGIVTGRVLAKVKMQDAPLVEDVRFTRVYRRTANGWRMIAGQGTRIAPPPAG
ncbi:MAG TPA: nuclear transport factor 2 family protein [Polyangiaceae bacterium]|nr:nuclear transport factor 2 family protein [Polyangiaceae bacterium]